MSLLSIISKNVLPKVFTIFGVVLWMTFYLHPRQSQAMRWSQISEYMAIVGGLLFMVGCDFFEVDFTFANLAEVQVPMREGEK